PSVDLAAVERQDILAVVVVGGALVEDHATGCGGPDPNSHGEGAGADDVRAGAEVDVAALAVEAEGLVAADTRRVADTAVDGAVVDPGAVLTFALALVPAHQARDDGRQWPRVPEGAVAVLRRHLGRGQEGVVDLHLLEHSLEGAALDVAADGHRGGVEGAEAN